MLQGRPPKAGFKNRSDTRACKSIDGAHPSEKEKELNPGNYAAEENPWPSALADQVHSKYSCITTVTSVVVAWAFRSVRYGCAIVA